VKSSDFGVEAGNKSADFGVLSVNNIDFTVQASSDDEVEVAEVFRDVDTFNEFSIMKREHFLCFEQRNRLKLRRK
jgi:hypothetical protein